MGKRLGEFMRQRLKGVKTTKEIRAKEAKHAVHTKYPEEKQLMKRFVDLEPINELSSDGTKAKYEPSIRKHFQSVLDLIDIDGYWMEMGVRGGRSVAWLLEKYPNQEYHGFDSWEGLPEKWDIGAGPIYQKGDMNVDMPDFPDNIKLHKGWFKDSLPVWKKQYTGPIAFIHIDSDLYSSCKTTLEELNEQIVPGTILAFDEFINFRLTKKLQNWYKHEWKAFVEWIHRYNRKVEPLTRNFAYQASCRVIE